MLFKGVKITVSMEQSQLIFDAKCSNQTINCFANSDAFGAEGPIVLGAFDGRVHSYHLHHSKFKQSCSRFIKILLPAKSLQHLSQNQVTCEDHFLA